MCAQRTWINLGNCPVWSESLLSSWRSIESIATQKVHSKDSDQTGWMPRLSSLGAQIILLVLLCSGSFNEWPTNFKTDASKHSVVTGSNNLQRQEKAAKSRMIVTQIIVLEKKWATSWQNQQNDVLQWRLRWAWASAHTDQSLRYTLNV